MPEGNEIFFDFASAFPSISMAHQIVLFEIVATWPAFRVRRTARKQVVEFFVD